MTYICKTEIKSVINDKTKMEKKKNKWKQIQERKKVKSKKVGKLREK